MNPPVAADTRVKLSDILARIESPKKTGTAQWSAHCPAHADSSPSLSLTLATDDTNATRVLIHCFAGCGFPDVCDALDLNQADLFDIEIDAPDVQGHTGPRTTRSSDNLSDRDLATLSARLGDAERQAPVNVNELDHRVTLTPEVVSAWRLAREGRYTLIPAQDIHGAVKGLRLRDFGPVPGIKELGLPNPDDPQAGWLSYTFVPVAGGSARELVVTEGPTDGLTMSALGYDVFAVFGVNAINDVVRRDLLAVATGRTVVVCSDADDAGRNFSGELARFLASNGIRVVVVEPPREKWDMNDWYREGREGFAVAFDNAVKASEDVVSRVSSTLRRFSYLPNDAWYDVLALWVVHAHMIRRNDLAEVLTIAPRVGFLSAVPGSGKTETTSLLATLIGAGMDVDPTPAVMVRTISASGYAEDDPDRPRLPVPLAVDEIDNLYGGKNVDRGQLTTIMNSGYKRGSQFRRADTEDPKKMHVYDVFATVVYNGLAKAQLPPALVSRSFLIEMEKATKSEASKLERFFGFRHGKMMGRLAQDCSLQADAWSVDQVEGATVEAMECLSEVTVNRDLELWSGLLTVAILMDEQSGHDEWVPRFWEVFEEITSASQPRSEPLSMQLLRAVRDVYAEEGPQHGLNEKGVWSETLIDLVCERDDTFKTINKGHPVTAAQMAGYLGDFKVSPRNIKMSGSVKKGYRWDDLNPVFERYLSDDPIEVMDDDDAQFPDPFGQR